MKINGTHDGFSLTCESEKIGKFSMDTKHSEEGIHEVSPNICYFLYSWTFSGFF